MPGFYRGPYEVWLQVGPSTSHRYEILDDYEDSVKYAQGLADETGRDAFVRDGPTGRVLRTFRQKVSYRKRWHPT